MDLVVSLDIHRDFSRAVVMNGEFDIVGEQRIGHDEHRHLDEFLGRFPRGTDLVMEATFNWPWIADLAQARGLSVHLANPMAARRLAAGMPKSDPATGGTGPAVAQRGPVSGLLRRQPGRPAPPQPVSPAAYVCGDSHFAQERHPRSVVASGLSPQR